MPDALIDEQIDASYFEVLTRYRHPEIEDIHEFDTVAGTIAYDLPEDYWYTQVMKDEDNTQRLLYRRINWLAEKDASLQGQPKFYTRHGDTWRLYPTPAAAYDVTVYYCRAVPVLAGGSTVFALGGWDEIVMWGAVWRVFQILQEQDRMIHTRNIWRTLVNSMPETDAMEGERSPELTGPLDTEKYGNEF